MIRALRLGIVPYLNVLPLIEGLEAAFPRREWTFATPRRLAESLAKGDLDVAIVSTFEALRRPALSLVPDCAIGCEGPVRSVQLFARRPVSSVKNVLLDRSSLTSIHLAQVLMADLHGVRPSYELSTSPLTPAACRAAEDYDGVVAIGDTALAMEGRWPHAMDLGVGWKELTGLPFAFAAWVVRDGLELTPDEKAVFLAAKERGVRSVDKIAAREASRSKFSEGLIADYLSNAIKYDLGPEQREAIEEFRRRLVGQGLLESPRALA